MEKGKSSYKIRVFLNAFNTFKMGNQVGRKSANTFEIICYITTTKEFVPFSQLETAVNNVIQSFTGKDLNKLAQFSNKDFSLEILTRYLSVMINNELAANGNKLSKIEVSQSPTRSFCLEFE